MTRRLAFAASASLILAAVLVLRQAGADERDEQRAAIGDAEP